MRATKVTRPVQAKLIVYFTQGPGRVGRTFKLQGKTLEAAINRGRKLVDRYRGKYTTACIYQSNQVTPFGPLLEQYNADSTRITNHTTA